MEQFRAFAPFTRIAKEETTAGGHRVLIVEATASSEAVDDHGTIIDYDALKKAAETYRGRIWEMHMPWAAGRALEVIPDDAKREIRLRMKIVDPSAIAKIEEEVYRGISIHFGPNYTRTGNRIFVKDWQETSLVDLPSNPDSEGFTFTRAAGLSPAKPETSIPERSKPMKVKDLLTRFSAVKFPEGKEHLTRSLSVAHEAIFCLQCCRDIMAQVTAEGKPQAPELAESLKHMAAVLTDYVSAEMHCAAGEAMPGGMGMDEGQRAARFDKLGDFEIQDEFTGALTRIAEMAEKAVAIKMETPKVALVTPEDTTRVAAVPAVPIVVEAAPLVPTPAQPAPEEDGKRIATAVGLAVQPFAESMKGLMDRLVGLEGKLAHIPGPGGPAPTVKGGTTRSADVLGSQTSDRDRAISQVKAQEGKDSMALQRIIYAGAYVPDLARFKTVAEFEAAFPAV